MGRRVKRCPLCGGADIVSTVTREDLPSMQNHVHRSAESARRAAEGEFTLTACRVCGFAWNSTFDPERLAYDAGYDNAVPSSVMTEYYEHIAEYLGREYDLARGYVVDIGCGNGTFLKTLARVWPECRGLGVDPALPHDQMHADGRVRLLKGVFDDGQMEQAPSLFVCRHVLEHMPDPVAFVCALRSAVDHRIGVPLFVEVPDIEWIVRHGAFWDFCYEHCNYFGEASLGYTLRRAGFHPVQTRVAFGDQYRWMEARAASGDLTAVDDAGTMARRLREYAIGEREAIDAVRRQLQEFRDDGKPIAVWGMATKGVIFSLLVDPHSTLIDFAVDVNTNKQGCFVPISGRLIEAPRALERAGSSQVAVIVMNTNYLQEIRDECLNLGVTADFFDATGREAGPV
jgi:SAM-dependent methyltransferase